MNRLSQLLTTVLITLLYSGILNAQGYQVNLQGQVQQGMAGAGAGLTTDAASLFFNPGGMSFVERSQVSLGSSFTFTRGNFYEHNTLEIGEMVSPVGTPFTAYGVFGLGDSSKLKLGLGVYTPFGSTVEWNEGWSGRFALTRLQLMSIFVQPTVSYKITKSLGIGAGFVYSYGKVNLQKDIPIVDQEGSYARAELDGTGYGLGYNVGVFYEPSKLFSVGFSYRSQVDMNLTSSSATFTVPSSLAENFPNGPFVSSLPLPQVFTLGFGSRPTNEWSVALDINYVGWNAFDTLSFDYENNTETLEDTKSARIYENTFAFRAGVEYKFMPNWKGRFGLAYALTPVPDGYVSPETPDADRLNYTFGIGYSIHDFVMDASLLYTTLEREDTNLETNLSGLFRTRVIVPGISIAYKL